MHCNIFIPKVYSMYMHGLIWNAETPKEIQVNIELYISQNNIGEIILAWCMLQIFSPKFMQCTFGLFLYVCEYLRTHLFSGWQHGWMIPFMSRYRLSNSTSFGLAVVVSIGTLFPSTSTCYGVNFKEIKTFMNLKLATKDISIL